MNEEIFVLTYSGNGKRVGIKVPEGDFIHKVSRVIDATQVFCITHKGFGFRFNLSDIRIMGGDTEGDSLINIEEGDSLIEGILLDEKDEKRNIEINTSLGEKINIPMIEIPILKRGSQGVRLIKLFEKDDVESARLI